MVEKMNSYRIHESKDIPSHVWSSDDFASRFTKPHGNGVRKIRSIAHALDQWMSPFDYL